MCAATRRAFVHYALIVLKDIINAVHFTLHGAHSLVYSVVRYCARKRGKFHP